MTFVQTCTNCGCEYREGAVNCPDCGTALVWATGHGSFEQSGGFTELPGSFNEGGGFRDALEGAGKKPPRLDPSPDLENVHAGPLDDVQNLGERLDRAGLPYRLELREPPSTGSPGLYVLQVEPTDLNRAQAEWDLVWKEMAPGPGADADEPSGTGAEDPWGQDAWTELGAWGGKAPEDDNSEAKIVLVYFIIFALGLAVMLIGIIMTELF